MIPNTRDRTISSSGVGASGEFAISLDDSAHIMSILRDTLYSDKVLAVLREYSANAWDAHRDAGKTDVPINITLPTPMAPTLSIRDFGKGLSQNEVFEVYTKYGKSTKRDSDNAVGMLGIGSKSGFAYSDSFNIISHHGGMKRTYVAVLDKSEKGIIQMLHEAPSEETGVLIQVAVRPKDISEFMQKAKNLFRYFNPRPSINTDLPALPEAQKTLKTGVIYGNGELGGWVAIMGCIPYRINLDQVLARGDGEEGVASFLKDLSGALYFNIGDVQISASREELKYSDSTKKALIEKFTSVVDEYVAQTLADINSPNHSLWERRVRSQVLRTLHLPIPKDSKDMIAESVPLSKWDSKKKEDKSLVPETFFIYTKNPQQPSEKIAINEGSSRFVLADDRRARTGFSGLAWTDYFVRPLDKDEKSHVKFSWDVVRKDLEKLIDDVGLTGIPIVKLSEMPWKAPRHDSNGKTINPKHKMKTFELKYAGSGWAHKPLSRYWEPISRVPTKDDLYVLIDGFKSPTFDIFDYYAADSAMAKVFKKEMPAVYGYKSTNDKPKDTKDLGTDYRDWRNEWLKSLINDEVKNYFELRQWAKVIGDSWERRKSFATLKKNLGEDHPIVKLIHKNHSASDTLEKVQGLEKALEGLEKFAPDLVESEEAKTVLGDLLTKYPLFKAHDEYGGALSCLWGKHSKEWCRYVIAIDAIDNAERKEHEQLTSAVHGNERVDHGCLGGGSAHGAEDIPSIFEPEEGDIRGAVVGHPQLPDGGQEPEGVVQG